MTCSIYFSECANSTGSILQCTRTYWSRVNPFVSFHQDFDTQLHLMLTVSYRDESKAVQTRLWLLFCHNARYKSDDLSPQPSIHFLQTNQRSIATPICDSSSHQNAQAYSASGELRSYDDRPYLCQVRLTCEVVWGLHNAIYFRKLPPLHLTSLHH
jgi:hypothetical protein